MISITVKTLASADYHFDVEEVLTVRELKQFISDTVNVPAERQRLIFQGRVLQDERKLSEIGLDRKTLHLVERLPGVPGDGSDGSSPLLGRRERGQRAGRMDDAAPQMGAEFIQQHMVMGAIDLQSDGLTREQIVTCLRRILNRLGSVGRQAQLEARETADGSSVEVDIRMRTGTTTEDSASGDRHVDGPATQRVQHIRHVIQHIHHILHHLENDTDTADQQATSAEPDSPPAASASMELCHGACSNDQTSGNRQETDAFEEYYYRETDVVDGEEMEIQQTRISGLAALLDEILQLENRLRPHLARYQQILRDDATYANNEAEGRRAGRLFNSIQIALHNLAHVLHTYSDLNVHFCQPPPRYLYPQLVGTQRQQIGTMTPQVATAMESTVEVQMTLSFRRRHEDSAQPTESVYAGQNPVSGAPAFGRFPSPFANVTGGHGAGYTTVNIGNAVPNPTVFHQAMNSGQQHQPAFVHISTPAGFQTQQQHQQQPQYGIPRHVLQQILQGVTGAATNAFGGNVAGMPNVQEFMGQFGPRFPGPNVNANVRPNVGATPRHVFISRMEPPRVPYQGQGVGGGQPIRLPPMLQGQHLNFVAAPYNVSSSHVQPALFVGYDPPATMPLYTFDEYLPCPSRHFNPRTRPSFFSHSAQRPEEQRGHSGANANGRETSNLQRQATTATDSEEALSEDERQFERHLEPVVRIVVDSLQDQIRRRVGPMQHRERQQILQFLPVPAGMPHLGARVGTPNSTRLRLPMDEMNQMRRPSSDPNLSRSRESASAATAPAGASDDERMVMEIFSRMMGRSSENFGDTLRAMGHEFERSSSILMDAAQAVLLSVSFQDIWAIFSNDATPLDRVRPTLRRYLVENVLNGNESPSEDDLRSAAARAASADGNMWRDVENSVETADNLDLNATMTRVEEAYIVDVLMLVFGYNFSPGESFGRRLYDRTWLFLQEAVTCANICFANDERRFDEFARRFLNSGMPSVSEEFRQSMSVSGLQHLRNLYANHHLERSTVERYLIRKDKEQSSASQRNLATASSKPDLKESVDSGSEVATTSSGQGAVTERSLFDDDWKKELPAEWSHVMEADVERQRSMRPQKPFSDAYASGMPPKKRKRSRALFNAAAASPDSFLKQALQDAIAEADVTPITGEQVEDVVDHVVQPELTNEFLENVKSLLGRRLRQEQKSDNSNEDCDEIGDFEPEKYPNATSKFLNK